MIDMIGEEKKEDIPSMVEAKILPQSASKRRAKAAGSAGLSELSKQLRIFQAKNEAQAVEINRLERQLRILADLQGISVADLRNALEAACANEAFGEMQHRVAKLRAELEAATLAKQAELRKDMAAPEIANLQLRIGELEEVEEKQEREIHHLYEELRHERARATRLESECEQYRKDTNDYHERLKNEASRAAMAQDEIEKLREEQAHLLQQGRQQNKKGDSLSSVSPEMAADYERLLESMKEKDDLLRQARSELKVEQEKSIQKMKDLDQQARKTQVDSKVDHEQMMLLIKQLQDADSQNDLRLAQYKTRFAVQDERITDMGQQLESLYAAFGLIKEEQDVENIKRAALQSSLNEADAAFAHQMDDKQKKKHKERVQKQQQRSSPGRKSVSNPQTNTVPTTPSSQGTPSEMYTPPTARAVGNPFSPTSDRSSGTRTPTTWQLIFPKDQQSLLPKTYFAEEPDQNGLLISGFLIVKSKSMVRKWKTKSSRLYLSGDHYQWDLGEGKSFSLQFGISKLEFYPNHPLSFIVYTNPEDPNSPIVQAATSCEADYNRWMSALTKATSGGQYHPIEAPPRRASAERGEAAAGNRSSVVGVQEASDFELALELSKQQS